MIQRGDRGHAEGEVLEPQRDVSRPPHRSRVGTGINLCIPALKIGDVGLRDTYGWLYTYRSFPIIRTLSVPS